jgi:hypothetical protein
MAQELALCLPFMLARHSLPPSSPETHPIHAHLPCTLPSLSFQQVTTVKFCNSLVLKTIQNAGGGWGPPLAFSLFDFPSSRFPYILPSSVSSNAFLFTLFQKQPGWGVLFPLWNSSRDVYPDSGWRVSALFFPFPPASVAAQKRESQR